MNPANPSESSPSELCTIYIPHRGKYTVQDYFHCRTCNMEYEGCCAICEKICHAGHDTYFVYCGYFFCDCSSSSKCNCNCKCMPNKCQGKDKLQVLQPCFQCQDCQLDFLCLYCAKYCHNGHQWNYIESRRFVCKCSCQSSSIDIPVVYNVSQGNEESSTSSNELDQITPELSKTWLDILSNRKDTKIELPNLNLIQNIIKCSIFNPKTNTQSEIQKWGEIRKNCSQCLNNILKQEDKETYAQLFEFNFIKTMVEQFNTAGGSCQENDVQTTWSLSCINAYIRNIRNFISLRQKYKPFLPPFLLPGLRPEEYEDMFNDVEVPEDLPQDHNQQESEGNQNQRSKVKEFILLKQCGEQLEELGGAEEIEEQLFNVGELGQTEKFAKSTKNTFLNPFALIQDYERCLIQ